MSPALLAVVGVVLVGSGLVHLRHRNRLRAALAQHRVLPPATRTPAAAGVLVLETVVGAALVLLVVLGDRRAVWAALVAAALLTAMTAYVHVAARRTGGASVPCGCGLGEAPLGLWVTVRAGLLATLALLGALTYSGEPLTAAPLAELVILTCATLALAVGIAVLPQARTTANEATP